jgi:hypothetical protein
MSAFGSLNEFVDRPELGTKPKFSYGTLTGNVGVGIQEVASTQAGVPATQSHVSVQS